VVERLHSTLADAPASEPLESGSVASAPEQVLQLQRTAGNAAVLQLMAIQRNWIPGALRHDDGTPEQIDKAIKGKDPGDVKAIDDFSQAKPGEKLQLVEVLLGQDTLGMFDKRAITRIFNSFGDLEKLDAAAVATLKKCQERGYSLHDLSRYDNLVGDFKGEVRSNASDNLVANIELIMKEAARLGASGDAAPTKEQDAALDAQQQLAQQIHDAKRLMAACSKIVVAHHGFLAGPEKTPSKVGDPIMFKPEQQPGGFGIDPVKTAAPAAHEMPWEEVYAQYSAMAKAVASVLNQNPALYALTSLTEAAPDAKATGGQDPHLNFGQQRITGFDTLSTEAARKKVRDALTQVYNNARLTLAKVMAGELSPLQMDSLIRRFHSGERGTRWAAPYPKFATQVAVADAESSFDRTMAEIGLALLLISVTIGTAGGATPLVGAILAGANVGTAAAGAALATLNSEDLNRASQSAVSDKTAIVSPEKAGKAELDAIMYTFAAVAAVAGEGAGMILSGAGESVAASNLGAVDKLPPAERASAIVDALETMEPGQVALRTGIPPDELIGIVAPRAASDPAAAAATNKLKDFLNRFSSPLIGPTAGADKTLTAMLRQAKMTVREYWSHVQGIGLREVNSVSLHTGFGDAELTYIKAIEDTAGREAGIYRNARTGEHAVVQGSGDWKGGIVEHLDSLPEAAADHWILVEHYHPERNFAVQFPSGGVDAAGQGVGDFAVLLHDYGETNIAGVLQGQPSQVITRRVSARIRYRDPTTGVYHYTTYGYDPANGPVGAFFVQAETETGAMVDYSFKDIAGAGPARADYERHLTGITRGQPLVKATP